jgi:hypothetical protein
MEQEQLPTPTLADRLLRISWGLMRSVGEKERETGWPLAFAVTSYIQRARNRILAVIAHVLAGTLRPIRPRAPRPDGAAPVPRRPPVIRPPYSEATPPPPLPRGFACLLPLMSAHAGVHRHYLMVLLDDPEMRAVLAAAPRIGRILRPLLHRLGLKTPPGLLPPPPPRRSRARPARTTPAGAEPARAKPARARRSRQPIGWRPEDSWMPHHPVQVRARLAGYYGPKSKKPG